ncbi:unnamed protein product [Urochloa humidicola]
MADAGGERWVGLATDFSEGSRAALRWAADNLLRSGDHLLLLHVVKEPDYEQSEAILWESTGSPLIPLLEFSDPLIAKKYGAKPDAETLDLLNTVAKQKEGAIGKRQRLRRKQRYLPCHSRQDPRWLILLSKRLNMLL